jgi:hypothetical protein
MINKLPKVKTHMVTLYGTPLCPYKLFETAFSLTISKKKTLSPKIDSPNCLIWTQ